MKKLIPADTVDAAGNVWETTGENIRHGAKEFSEGEVKVIIDIMFPVGSLFIGDNNAILSVGHWELATPSGLYVMTGTIDQISGSTYVGTLKGDDSTTVSTIHIWKRVS